jgi:hypothetical protein
MKHIRTRKARQAGKARCATSALRARLSISLIAFPLMASALISGAVQRIELSIMLAFLGYVVISTTLGVRDAHRQKMACIDTHLDRLAARLAGQPESDAGPWGMRSSSQHETQALAVARESLS